MEERATPLSSPSAPFPGTRFSGWRIVLLAAIAIGMTGPAQTPGVSVFIDPMIETLALSRSQVSTAYLLGTLLGSLGLFRIGRVIDNYGTRVAMTLVAVLTGLMLMAMGGIRGLVTLTVGFAGIRLFGHGALNLVATTAVAPWFHRRRGLATGVLVGLGSSLRSFVPLLSRSVVIPAFGWRGAWVAMGAAAWFVLVPIGIRGLIDRPNDVGQQPDGDPPKAAAEAAQAEDDAAVASFTLAQAARTSMFWAIAGAVGVTAMISTGLAFHQIELLGEQGLTPDEAAANFIPQTLAALVATLAAGDLIDRFAPRWVLALSMALLVGGMMIVPFVSPGPKALIYAVIIGSAGSVARTLEAATFPKIFGLAHVGSIRSAVSVANVASSAFGPLAMSLGKDVTGSYIQVLWLLLALPAAVAIMGFIAKPPLPYRR